MAHVNAARSAVIAYVLFLTAIDTLFSQSILSQTLDSTRPLEIHISESLDPFYLQKAMLASASPKLAAAAVTKNVLLISNAAFQIFIVWLLHRELSVGQPILSWVDKEKGQKSLAEAWNFGARYEIPTFQNAVMRVIVSGLQEGNLHCAAVQEAYQTTRRGTKLQSAVVTEVARCCLYDKDIDTRKGEFEARSLEKVPGLCLDLATALVDELDRAGEPLDVDDFLVNEHSQDDEDSDGDDSLTDG